MTLEEAKKLYRDCGGDDPYIIWHEAGEKTLAEYSALNIPFEVKREWAAEILEQDFASMQREPDRSSSAVADILTMMNYEYVNAQMIGAGLLDALEDQMRREDPSKLTREQAMNRILIIEDMTSLLRKKGGCQLFYEYTTLAPRMRRVMEAFSDFVCPTETRSQQGRRPRTLAQWKKDADVAYRAACNKWS